MRSIVIFLEHVHHNCVNVWNKQASLSALKLHVFYLDILDHRDLDVIFSDFEVCLVQLTVIPLMYQIFPKGQAEQVVEIYWGSVQVAEWWKPCVYLNHPLSDLSSDAQPIDIRFKITIEIAFLTMNGTMLGPSPSITVPYEKNSITKSQYNRQYKENKWFSVENR